MIRFNKTLTAMNALIMLLNNQKEKTFHPIFYLESPLPGNPSNIIRYKSKGHHTKGFKLRDDAINDINTNLSVDVAAMGYKVNVDISDDLIWDGEDIPADIQFREP